MKEQHEQRTVTVPREYFEKAKADYGDWRWAWVREVVQNSVDAGATKIGFSVNQHQDGLQVSTWDNGRGMNYDTLVNVFLCLGGSQKDVGSTGGFGVAKNLVVLCHQSYTIETQDWLVKGQGGEYTIGQSNYLGGTRITVNMGAADREQVVKTIKDFVAQCFLDRVEFSLLCDDNAIFLEQDLVEYEDEIETALGTLWYTEDPDAGNSRLLIAYNGLPMFNHTVYNDGTAFRALLNIKGDYTWFTSNRDGLIYEHRRSLALLVDQLSTQRESLNTSGSVDLMFNQRLDRGLDPDLDPDSVRVKSKLGLSNDSQESLIAQDAVEHARQRRNNLLSTIVSKFDTVNQYHARFVLRLDCINGRGGELSARDVYTSLNKVKSRKLAQLWADTVNHLCRLPVVKQALYGTTVDTGFIYTTKGLEAVCRYESDQYTILINPLLLASDWDQEDVFDLAVHEVAHILVSGHGQDFCGAEQKIRREYRRCDV